MELYGLMFKVAWLVFCTVAITNRLASKKIQGYSAPSASFELYLALTLSLGVSIIFQNARELMGTANNLQWIISLWAFLWSPISLRAIFLAPKRLCCLPAAFITVSAIFGIVTQLLINDYDPWPPWVALVDIAIGFCLVAGAIATHIQTYRRIG